MLILIKYFMLDLEIFIYFELYLKFFELVSSSFTSSYT